MGRAAEVPQPTGYKRVMVGLPLGDVDGDGRADIGAINREDTTVTEDQWALVVPSPGARVAPDLDGVLGGKAGLRLQAGPQAEPTHLISIGDFDGDGRDDLMMPLWGAGGGHPHLIVYGREGPATIQVDEV